MALYVAGEILTASNLNRHFAACQVHDASQSLTDAVGANITFDSDEQLDTHGWHDNSTNPSRVTPNITGWYEVTGKIQLVSATTAVTRLSVSVFKNGSVLTEGVQDYYPAAVNTTHRATVVTPLVSMNGSTDYFELNGFQDDSGGAARAVESWLTVKLIYPT